MPTFSYRALSQVGEIVSGSIAAPTAAEVGRRIEYLGLIPIDSVAQDADALINRGDGFALFSRPRAEDVTVFTGDLAVLLRTGVRINEALELLAADSDIGRMRSTAKKVTAAILAGESFADAISHHSTVFPPIYVALTRVGEASGNLVPILEAISGERQRAEALRRHVSDTLRYPAFLLAAAGGVLLFFLLVVLPQFANVFQDFQRETGSGSCDLSRHFEFPAQGHEHSPRRPDVSAVSRPSSVSTAGGPRSRDRRSLASSACASGAGIRPHRPFLSQPWTSPGKRGDLAGEPAHSRRYDGDVQRHLDLDRSR